MVPPAAGRIVAVIVIVTEPPAGMAPFQVTVLVPTLPAEVDTPILDVRPHPPDAKARAILFCVTLPPRTGGEEIVMSPTMARDHSAEIATARRLGEPARR